MSKSVKVIFDIETVRAKDELDETDLRYDNAWLKFSERKYKDDDVFVMYEDKAGLIPEFGVIVCIVAIDSINKIPVRFKMILEDEENDFKKAEREMLERFYEWLNELEQKGKKIQLMGHNIKKFDIPYVNVRSVKHQMKLHGAFKMFGVKPWDLDVVDTMEVWRGGLFSSIQASSLDDVCRVLGVKSPKGGGEDGLDGSMVGNEFWRGEGTFAERVERICNYCERDVVQNGEVINKMFSLNMI